MKKHTVEKITPTLRKRHGLPRYHDWIVIAPNLDFYTTRTLFAAEKLAQAGDAFEALAEKLTQL